MWCSQDHFRNATFTLSLSLSPSLPCSEFLLFMVYFTLFFREPPVCGSSHCPSLLSIKMLNCLRMKQVGGTEDGQAHITGPIVIKSAAITSLIFTPHAGSKQSRCISENKACASVYPDPTLMCQPTHQRGMKPSLNIPNVSVLFLTHLVRDPFVFVDSLELGQAEKRTAALVKYSVLSISTLGKRVVNYHCSANHYIPLGI